MDKKKVYHIKRHEVFKAWFKKLKKRDSVSYMRIDWHLQQIEEKGLLGDWQSVGGGVFELRFHWNQGYRVYYMKRGLEVIFLLCGGNKSEQESDIKTAKKLAKEVRDAEQNIQN